MNAAAAAPSALQGRQQGMRRAAAVLLAVFFALSLSLLASPAYATHCGDGVSDAGTETCPAPAPEPASASSIVTDAFTQLKDEIFTILPVAIGGLVVFMAIRVGLKYLNKAARKA